MSATPDRSRWLARLVPFAVAMASLPLLAPTCGNQSPGVKAFSKGSIIIPMDRCYQGDGGTPAACPGAGDAGNVVKAYGLVYRLIRAGIPVYWVIDRAKASLTGVDVTIQLSSGPVGKYDWTNGTFANPPPNNSTGTISYLGGPFVVDGSDFATADGVMRPGLAAVFSGVNVHVSNVAFEATVAKVMSGGWDAGANIAPPIALLDIKGGDGTYAEPVIQGYLDNAGLGAADFPGAGGTASGTHGAIYDTLQVGDFQPSYAASRLGLNGYKVLWVPHWTGPNSYVATTGTARISQADLDQVLASVSGFINAGHDMMSECGSIGTFEGAFDTATCTTTCAGGYTCIDSVTGATCSAASPCVNAGACVNNTYGAGSAGTRLQTTAAGAQTFPAGGGVFRNEGAAPGGYTAASYNYTGFETPFMQIGDFPYAWTSGVIDRFRLASTNNSVFQSGVQELIKTDRDLFTLQPGTGGRGTVVYLAGHSYTNQIAGTRLVLNTLFNLSAACAPRLDASGHPATCTQPRLKGVCQAGTWQCCEAGDITKGYCSVAGEPVCRPTSESGTAETCNGLDDNCDGLVDNIDPADAHVTTPGCYVDDATGLPPGGSPGVGICQSGSWVCQQSPAPHWACIGWVGPRAESCNGLDDDCNGTVDDGVAPPGGNATCYTAGGGCTIPAGGGAPVCTGCYQATAGGPYACKGECKAGSWQCQPAVGASGGVWVCNGQVGPSQEICEGQQRDYNCNGVVADGCACVPGTERPCVWPGPGTPGLGICRTGTQTCGAGGAWNSCVGQVVGQASETCGNGLDDDCNGTVDDAAQCSDCQAGQTRSCYPSGATGCTGTPGSTYTCAGVCAAGQQACVNGSWGACTGAVVPSAERCDGRDNDCDPATDEASAPCPANLACINGACTIPTAMGETTCDSGYRPASGATGPCVPVDCPAAPCAAGTVCQGGTTCGDPCVQKSCGEGAYCSGGVCIGGGCYATGCTAPAVCRNGTCQADVCSGATCPDGTFCRGNYTLAQPTYDCVKLCATVTCPTGQACGADGTCAPDPCATQDCPAGQVCRASGATATCIANPCPAGACGTNQTCIDGRCTDDPCAGVVCPAGICNKGQCYASNNPNGYGPRLTEIPPSSGKSGCGCGGGEAGTSALLLSLFALPLARRRSGSGARRPARRGGAGLATGALLAGALLLAGAGCSKKKASAPLDCETCGTDHCVDVRFDVGHCKTCGVACSVGQACVDTVCVASAPAVPAISSVTPGPVAAHTTPTFTILGERFQSGATVRVSGVLPAAALTSGVTVVSSTEIQAAVDLAGAGLGSLRLQVANADHTVSNIVQVEVVTPTPSITGISPSTGVAGTRVPVTVTGTAFTDNAICVLRVGTADTAIPPAAPPSCAAGSCTMSCTVDLGAVVPGAAQLIVQNENRVQSAPADFTVTSLTPTVTSLSPNPAQQGAQIRLVVTGSSFVPGAVIQIDRGSGFLDQMTEYGAATLLATPLSLAGWAAGSYPVRVANPGVPPSDPLSFTVDPSPPVATGLTVTPSAPRVGDASVQLDLTGSGFGASCSVQVKAEGGAGFDYPAATAAGTTAGAIRATISLASAVAGTYNARVSCPTGCASPPCFTTAYPFPVATNVATLATVTPAGGTQGTSVPVTVTGTNFQAGMVLRLGSTDAAATFVSATEATATLNLAGATGGMQLLKAVNDGAAESNGIAFTVTPGAPTLTSLSTSCTPAAACTAACAVQGNAVTVTLLGTNFVSGSSVVKASFTPTGSPSPLSVNLADILGSAAITVPDGSHVQVALDTTKVVATVYGITVENPGQPATASLAYKVSTACP